MSSSTDAAGRPSALDRFDNGFRWINAAVLAVMMMAMLGLVFFNVASRNLVSVSYGWVDEVSRYLMIWIVFLGIGLALREGMHVAVTIFVDIARRARPALIWIGFALVFAFFAALVWYGYQYASFASRQRSAMLNLPMGMIYLAIPIGSALAIVHMAFMGREIASELKEPGK